MNQILTLSLFAAWLISAAPATAEAPSDTPKAVPATRPEIKAALEALKYRAPRLPLPEAEGEGGVNNGRMRAQYLPASWSGRRGRSGQSGLLEYPLTVSCFWIASRGNNCQYCLGHQELKLRSAGVDEDAVAALDSDWSRFDPRKQAALAFARKLTLEPFLMADADVARLRAHYSDAEILELAYSVSRFNGTNRWTDGLGIPQDRRFHGGSSELTTPTSPEFHNTISVASPNTRAERPGPPSWDAAQAEIRAAANRTARIKMPDGVQTDELLSGVAPDRQPWAWERAMSSLGETGVAQAKAWNTIVSDDHLPIRLKSELAFIAAMHNHAWYAAAHAARSLRSMGATPRELAALAEGVHVSNAGPEAAYRLAMKLTDNPHLITDADIASVREQYGDAHTAQIVHVICMANLFDRFTESLGLPVENAVAEQVLSM